MRIGSHSHPRLLTNGGVDWKRTQRSPTRGNGLVFIVMAWTIWCLCYHVQWDFIPYGMQQYHLSLLLLVKCYLRSLSKWQDPTGNFIDIFHHFKIIYTTRGPKEGKEEEITFFYSKEATLNGIWIGGSGSKITISLTIAQNLVDIWSSIRSMAWLGW